MTQQIRQPQSVSGLLADIGFSVLSLIKGHIVTLKNFWRKKATDQYPHEREPERNWCPPPGYRGDFALIAAPERPGGTRCIACLACQNICPVRCIHISPAGKGKERFPQQFYIDIGKCMYCWLCVESCPVGALTMTRDYHNVAYKPEELIRDLKELKRRGEGISDPEVPAPPEKTSLAAAKRSKEEAS